MGECAVVIAFATPQSEHLQQSERMAVEAARVIAFSYPAEQHMAERSATVTSNGRLYTLCAPWHRTVA